LGEKTAIKRGESKTKKNEETLKEEEPHTW